VVELLLSCLRLLVTGEQMITNHVEKKGKPSSTSKDGQSSATIGPLHHTPSTLPSTGRVDAVSLQQVNSLLYMLCLTHCLYTVDGHGVH